MVDMEYENYLSDENDMNIDNDENNEYNEYNDEDYKDPQFLIESDIIKEREKAISQAQEKLFLERNDTILALIYYKWNIDNLDNWYDNIEQNKINSGIELSEDINKKLINEGVKSNGDICLICYEKKNNNFYSLNCGHQFCNECWANYLKEKIKLPLKALQVKCPQYGCTCIVYENLYYKYLKNNDLIKNLNIAIYTNYINRNDDIKKCPNRYCLYFIKSNNHYAREIICLCGTSFCYKCLNFFHNPCTCDIVKKWCELTKKYNNICSDEELNNKWIKANTKECPNCHQKIEKNKGCNYMYCDPKAGGCGHSFCYICEIDWKSHINNHFYCNNYNEEIKQKEIYAKKLRAELEINLIEDEFFKKEGGIKTDKLFSYYDKYRSYDNSINICNILKNTLEEKVKLISNIHNIHLIDLSFFKDAIETLINTKKILKNTYIFGYFMKDGARKNDFENLKEILEILTDNLCDKLVDKEINMLIKINSLALIKKYKTSINSLVHSINNGTKTFTDRIENEFILELDDELLNKKYK